MSLQIEHVNPPGMRQNPAFTNAVVVSGAARTIYIGAIDPVDVTGALVGRGDLAIWGRRPNPPANTIVFVPSLGYPDSLIALEAVAIVPE